MGVGLIRAARIRGCLAVVIVSLLAVVWGGERAVAQPCEPEWSSLDSGVSGGASPFPWVTALTVFDDGTDLALYASGNFTQAGENPANFIARWNGSSWMALGTGVGGEARALAVYDDGSGPALYVAGYFSQAGGSPAENIARWDGWAWTPLGEGLRGGSVRALTVFDDGSGPALYAAGRFTQAGEGAANGIARWDGSRWSPLGEGVSGGSVRALTVFDDGTGPALYAGGLFTHAGGAIANYVARWDGSAWTPLGSGLNDSVGDMVVYDDGTGPSLYVGGSFTHAGPTPASQVARWDGLAWSTLGSGVSGGRVAALDVFDDGSGLSLYIGGNITEAGGEVIGRIARWDGHAWSSLSDGAYGTVNALTVFDDGSGRALYAGGAFVQAGETLANRIARWGCIATTPCHADLDADGTLTIFDFLAFQNAFDAGDPQADFDGDGSLTIFDFLAFQSEFDAGCE